jgi:Domain of unknown function (DUF4390)
VLGSVGKPSLSATRRSIIAQWLSAAAAALLGSAPLALAQEDDEGSFEVRTASSELIDGVYYVNSLIDLRMSREATEALDSGVPLVVRIEIDLIRVRRFWIDDEEYDVDQRFVLEHHALTERYIVRNLNRGDQASFATLTAALSNLGRIERLPLIDATLLEPGRSYDARIRVELDMDEFSGPLRLLTFWRREFSLSSEWFRWRLLSS